MEQQDSIKGELQTLIALEQQQNQTLDAIHSRGAFNPTMTQVNGFGFGQSHYMPNAGGFQKIPIVGEYANQVNDTLNYAASGVTAGMKQMNNFNQKVRNAAIAGRVDSANWVAANQSKLSLEARELIGADLGEKLATGTLGATSMLANLGGSAIGSAIGSGFIGSMIGGAVGGAAVGAVVDIGVDQMKQNFAYNKYLLQNSYRFINPFESNNGRNVSGFNRSERWDTSNWLRKFNTSMKISDNDTMTLLQGFTEGDLLRDVSDVETFKKKMTDLTKSVKTMALSLNETYEEVVQTMADLKKAGLDTRDYKSIAGLSKITASLTGQDAGDVVDYQKNLATALNNGTSLDINKTMSLVQNTESFLGALYTDAEKNYDNSDEAKLLYNRFNNRGGIEGATSDYLQIAKEMLGTNGTWFNASGAAFYNWNAAKGEWEFSQEDYNALKNSSLTKISKAAEDKMNAAGMTGIQEWTNNSGNIMMGDFGDDLQKLAGLFSTITNAAKKVAEQEGWNTEAAMEQLFGMEGEDTKFMAMTTDAINARPELHGQIQAMGFAQTMIDNMMSERAGASYEFKNWWGGVKDAIGDVFAPVGQAANSIGEGISDWWYGKPYDMNQLRERWGNMDWESSPTKGIEDALAKYADAVQKAGNTNSDIAKLFGITENGDIGTRNVYSATEDLSEALKGLADDVKSYAEVIRQAAEDSNVSENVAAAALNALNIKDSDKSKAKSIISQIGEEKNLGIKEDEALKKVLLANGASEDKVNETIESLHTSGSKYFTEAEDKYLKTTDIVKDKQTAAYFGNTTDKTLSKSATLSDGTKLTGGMTNTDVAMAEILGLDVSVSDDFWDKRWNNEISVFDKQRINQATLSYISETAALMQDRNKWESLTFQEQTDRLNAVYLGAPLLMENGLTSDNIQDALKNNKGFRSLYNKFGANNSNTRKSLDWINDDIMGEYLLNTDEKRNYYKEKSGDTSPSSADRWKEFLNNGASNMYDSDTPEGRNFAKYQNISMEDAIDEIKKDNKELEKDLAEIGKERSNLGQKILDSITDPEKKKEATALILNQSGATKDQLREYGIEENTIDAYVAKNEEYNNTYNQIKAGNDFIAAYGETEADSEAKAAAYLMLGKAVGVDATKLNMMQKNLKDFRKMDKEDIDKVFANSQDVISEAMFGEGIVGTEVNEESRKQIAENLTNALSSSGSFNRDQIASMVDTFIYGTNNKTGDPYLKDGETVTKAAVDTFTSSVLGGITNGNIMTKEASLEKSIDELKTSVDAATDAIKGSEGWKDPNTGSSNDSSKSTNGKDGIVTVDTNLNLNPNGSSTSTFQSSAKRPGNFEY